MALELLLKHAMRVFTASIAIAGALVATPRRASASPPTSCVPGFAYGAFGQTSLTYGGNSGCDAWNSSLGSYSTAPNPGAGCNLGTDGTANKALTIDGNAGAVYGNIYYGAGGSSSTLNENPGSSATIQGSSGALPSNLALPAVTLPTLPSAGSLSCSTACTATANSTYTSITGNVTFPPGAYVVAQLGTGNGASGQVNITVTSGPVTIYIGNVGSTTVNFNVGTVTNLTGDGATWGYPADLVFMITSSLSSLTMSMTGYFAIYAPNTDVTDNGNGAVYGAIIGNNVTFGGTINLHYDTALATTQIGNFTCATTEVSRATPIVATLPNGNAYLVQGSYEAPWSTATTITSSAASGTGTIAAFTFPNIKGHLRAHLESDVTTSASLINSSTATFLFDTGESGVGMLPTAATSCSEPYHGACRAIFTTTANNSTTTPTSGVVFHPAMVTFSNANASTIGPLLVAGTSATGFSSTQYTTLVQKILSAGLGGVDRSTVAVIQASTYAGNTSRPTMIYFGAADGMLHAVCAQTGGTTATQSNVCSIIGSELWAFAPRVQLASMGQNNAKIDGSPRVLDVYGDFTNATPTGSTKAWKTVLVFQTGYTSSAALGGATYALDITDPASPSVLWEYARPWTPSTIDLGTGLTVASGPASISGSTKNLTVLETNNGGGSGSGYNAPSGSGTGFTAGSAGVFAAGVYTESGSPIWTTPFSFPYYTNTTSYVAASENAFRSAIPGGAVGADLTGNGSFTDFVAGDIDGDLWRLNPATGASQNGTNTPLFAFSSSGHPIGVPPAIYQAATASNTQVAVVTSGGYDDPIADYLASGTQYAVGVKINSTAGTINETSASLAFPKVALTGNGFAQALIVGGELFLTSDTTDVNATGYGISTGGMIANGTTAAHLTGEYMTVALSSGTASAATNIFSGAGSVVNDGSKVFTGGGNAQVQLGTTDGSTGLSVDLKVVGKFTRELWLRTQ